VCRKKFNMCEKFNVWKFNLHNTRHIFFEMYLICLVSIHTFSSEMYEIRQIRQIIFIYSSFFLHLFFLKLENNLSYLSYVSCFIHFQVKCMDSYKIHFFRMCLMCLVHLSCKYLYISIQNIKIKHIRQIR
jgi:hypothetical protein